MDQGEDCDDGRNGNDLDGCRDDCRFTCFANVDCDDRDACTGTETCGADHKCAAGVALDCADTNACTTDQCDRTTGCSHSLIDVDGDGFAPLTIAGCGTDCNDGQPAVKPGAVELSGDGVDQNCDGTELCYVDGDNDGYRTSLTVASVDLDCDDLGEASATDPSGDCNDGVPAIRPGATESAGDLVDQNCDGAELCYVDGDNDGYRSGTLTVASVDLDCNDPGEATAGAFVDCNDGNSAVNPGVTEVCGNGIDDNCNNQSDELPECFITCNWTGARWLSHGWDGGNSRDWRLVHVCQRAAQLRAVREHRTRLGDVPARWNRGYAGRLQLEWHPLGFGGARWRRGVHERGDGRLQRDTR